MEEDKVSVEVEQQLPDFIPEDSVIQKDINDVYGKKIVAEPKPSASVGADIDEKFYQDIIAANENNALDVSVVQSFTQLAQSRDQLYKLLDDMADDPTVAAILRAYVENAVEPNENGQVVWVESSDADCAKMVEFLLEAMDVDKNSYEWVMRLCKYGDLYLHLFRKSELQDELFKTKEPEEDKFDKYYNGISEKEHKSLNEDVLIRAYSKNDHYSHYVEAEANPAEHFELVKHGKSCGYITADISTNVFKDDNPNLTQLRYGFKKQDVIVDEATEFVHACLDSGVSRVPETVDIFLTDKTDINSPKASYTVRKGRSLLYDAYQSWRLLSLLENSLLLNRITKSQLIRLITMDVGGMPQDDVAPLMQALKKQLEQKTAINVSKYLEEYTNPGAIENNVYWTTRNGLGGISIQNIGGEYDPKSLIDLDYFKNKMFGAFSVPKQFFAETDDSTGFNGGTSLSIISSQFAKKVKSVQNAFLQCLTDAINFMFIDKRLNRYVNNFKLKMTPPITQEELDRRENAKNGIGVAQDVLNMLDDIDDPVILLKIKKSLLSKTLTDSEIINLIQEKIDTMENEQDQVESVEEEGEPGVGEPEEVPSGFIEEPSESESPEPAEEEPSLGDVAAGEKSSPEETILPTADELGIDMTSSED